MTVSIAMATFNGARYLREQLESLASQTLTPAELVVCDDGSTDGTIAILQAFARVAPFPVRVHVNPARLGYGANFIRCASLCSSALIAFCDQDDVWESEKLQRCADALEKADVFMVFHNAEIFSDHGRHGLLYPASTGPSEVCFGKSPFFLALGFTLVFRRDLLALNPLRDRSIGFGLEPKPLNHDQWISLLGNVCGPVRYLPEPLARYRRHLGNVFLNKRRPLRDRWTSIVTSGDRARLSCRYLGTTSGLLATGAAIVPELAPQLQHAADRMNHMAGWAGKRASLYGDGTLLGRCRRYAELLQSRAFRPKEETGLEVGQLAKDLLVGVPFGGRPPAIPADR